ncbi:MAG: hypothetical protein AB7L76_02415, partial [Burkholderiaceae bacterium]
SSHPEFDAWRWNEYWVPLDAVIEFKRDVYSRALNELSRFLRPGDPRPPGRPGPAPEARRYLRGHAWARGRRIDAPGQLDAALPPLAARPAGEGGEQ